MRSRNGINCLHRARAGRDEGREDVSASCNFRGTSHPGKTPRPRSLRNDDQHKWQVGDLLMWDNATSMHLAICDYQLPERRLMYRTTVIGDVPV